MRAACYARVSKFDQKTLSAQMRAMKAYANKHGWKVVAEVKEVGPGATSHKKRQALIDSAVQREIDSIIVWKLDRWGRSLIDLMTSLKDLSDIGVGFVSITEALDLTTTSGRAFANMLNVFAEFERNLSSKRIKAGIAKTRKKGHPHGRPVTVGNKKNQIEKLFKKGVSKSEIARKLKIGRTSVRRLLNT
jgi:putative DNA-invertase from lambdoid prophage Rac